MKAPLDEAVYQNSLLLDIDEVNTPQDWKALRFFNLYRVVLAGFLTSSLLEPGIFEYQDTRLFTLGAFSYLGFALFSGFAIRYRWFPFGIQVMVQGLADIIGIGLLMHASEGVNSGLGMLLIVAIAGSSMVTEGRTAFFFAAIASLMILIETVLTGLYLDSFNSSMYVHAGILGATFFATAFLAHFLAKRIRVNETLAYARGLHVQYLARLNEQIVEHIQSGILVADGLYRIRLFNEAAKRLLGLAKKPIYGTPLAQVSNELREQVGVWRKNPQPGVQLFRPNNGEVDVLASFTSLVQGDQTNTLVLLEDATLTSQRAHQLKLVSLGRLTASIAHEVRNPLGAISHAAQLLEESPELEANDKHLIEIILNHVQRVNTVVENVLQLSRQRDSEGTHLELHQWLRDFVAELQEANQLRADDIAIIAEKQELTICFDPHQLHQVLWNLCENALRYSKDHRPLVELYCGIGEESHRPYLDVQDYGPGLSAEARDHVFEPFFTGEAKGTGLGLYLARGFCEANRASLHVVDSSRGGSCFRIHFAPE